LQSGLQTEAISTGRYGSQGDEIYTIRIRNEAMRSVLNQTKKSPGVGPGEKESMNDDRINGASAPRQAF
jgi:hypothetical protein